LRKRYKVSVRRNYELHLSDLSHFPFQKSVETFYQESGRAGRDGKDADCILYYRLQDALRVPGILQGDWERRSMLSTSLAHDVWLMHSVVSGMIRFCLDFKGCRKLIFAKHVSFRAVWFRFRHANTQNSYFSSSDWAEDNTRCGHCDNCTRDPTSVIESDVTLEAKRVLAVARVLHSKKINVSAAQLAQAARGSGQHAKQLQLSPGDRLKLSSHVRGLSFSCMELI